MNLAWRLPSWYWCMGKSANRCTIQTRVRSERANTVLQLFRRPFHCSHFCMPFHNHGRFERICSSCPPTLHPMMLVPPLANELYYHLRSVWRLFLHGTNFSLLDSIRSGILASINKCPHDCLFHSRIDIHINGIQTIWKIFLVAGGIIKKENTS